MSRLLLALSLVATCSTALHAQSLYLKPGEPGIEVSAGWSVGPSSNGVETFVGFSPNGRVDVGLSISRYTYSFDDGSKSRFNEFGPFIRYFAVKQQDGGPPVSLAVSGQLFLDDYASDEDSGRFVQLGAKLYKALTLTDGFEIQPFVGFAFVAESYSFGGAAAERAQYLTRDLGVHLTTNSSRPWILRLTVLEQSFRRETYRGVRASFVRRF